jgi:hypothetical protein
MNTCRLCGGWKENNGNGVVLRYGPRHYAHARCGLDRWKAEFFTRLSSNELARFPFLFALDAGLLDELKAEYERRGKR